VGLSPAPAGPGSGARGESTLSVVICAYSLQRWNDVGTAVASVRGQSRPSDQIVLVIDHNADLYSRAVTAFPDVLVVANEGRQGLSDARNTGVRASTGDVVAFLDDDAAADPAWAECLLAAYTEPSVLGVGGWVVPDWRAPRPRWFPDEFLWVVGCSFTGLPRHRGEVRNPIGANMSFRRAVLLETGGFDPDMGRFGADAAGCEETELSIRARRERPEGRILLEPAAVCRHGVTPDRITRAYFRQRCRAEGRSKALVSRLAGAEAALETERAYVRRTLPAGVRTGLTALLRGDPAGGARAWAIVEGLTLTAMSYALTRMRQRRRPLPGTATARAAPSPDEKAV
jgi:GT2 family glycosyltransferase